MYLMNAFACRKMETTKDKTKEKDEDGLTTIAIEDIKDSVRATIPHLDSPSPKTPTTSKARVMEGQRQRKTTKW
jgi:hypothetical protein